MTKTQIAKVLARYGDSYPEHSNVIEALRVRFNIPASAWNKAMRELNRELRGMAE